MFTGLATDTAGREPALVEDLATDPADLIDLAATLGVEFRSLISELLESRAGTPRELIAALERRGAGRSQAIPLPSPPPFVWARIRAPRRGARTVRAGWLTPAALATLVADTRAAGPAAELDVIVPLDSGDGAVSQVRTLCAAVADDVRVSVRVQAEGDDRERWTWKTGRTWLGSGARARTRAPRGISYRATWVAFDSLGATR